MIIMDKKEPLDVGVKKKVDEAWKESVAKEKHTNSVPKEQQSLKEKDEVGQQKESTSLPEPDFSMFISGIGMQALMHLGEIENPLTGKKQKDMAQAKYVIDILGILKDKTKNNLSVQESNLLDNLLYDLRMKYVNTSK